jgi:hypothetical protein
MAENQKRMARRVVSYLEFGDLCSAFSGMGGGGKGQRPFPRFLCCVRHDRGRTEG